MPSINTNLNFSPFVLAVFYATKNQNKSYSFFISKIILLRKRQQFEYTICLPNYTRILQTQVQRVCKIQKITRRNTAKVSIPFIQTSQHSFLDDIIRMLHLSNVLLLCSCQIAHIRQNRTAFHILAPLWRWNFPCLTF